MSALLPSRRPRERALLIAVVIATMVIVGYGVVQYRWSRDVSDAAAVRLADTLQMSIVNWQVDLLRTVTDIAEAIPTGVTTPEDAQRYIETWRARAHYPLLVAGVSVVRRPGKSDGREWRFQANPPALLRPIPGPTAGDGEAWLAVALDPTILRGQIFSDLAYRYFQGTDGLDYEVAVVAKDASRTVLYTSDPGFGDEQVTDADGTLQVFAQAGTGEAPIRVFSQTLREKDHYVAAMSWFPLMPSGGPGESWELVVRHRRGGPLSAFLEDTRQRDLTIGVGALLLLVASIGLLVLTSARAQRLAGLQMDFVTAVSHELRTPLSVISSAADNIAQGIVDEPKQMRQYGSVIAEQATQLSTLVEHILRFAAQPRSAQRFTMKPLAVSDIVDATIASTEGLIRAADFTIERSIEPNLPPVKGDLVALSQCLQNLVTNALKYGRDSRWLGIRARLVTEGGAREVQIAVEDRGIGIARSERARVFEPFYRSPSATAAQIHGTGLGLALAKTTAEAMGGRLTVSSEAGRGSIFTLHLPVADVAAVPKLAPASA
jgi:signal transduction histidine kinase